MEEVRVPWNEDDIKLKETLGIDMSIERRLLELSTRDPRTNEELLLKAAMGAAAGSDFKNLLKSMRVLYRRHGRA